jgi:hypothetical protein
VIESSNLSKTQIVSFVTSISGQQLSLKEKNRDGNGAVKISTAIWSTLPCDSDGFVPESVA